MDITIERRISELCDLAAREHDYTKLKTLSSNSSNVSTLGNSNGKRRRRFRSLEVDKMKTLIKRLCSNEEGQDIAEYGVILAVILVLVVGTVRLVGSHANNVFSSVSSSVY